VLALIGIHGLQARAPATELTIKDLVRRQIELVRAGFGAAPIALSDDSALAGLVLTQEAAVPMALIVTELLVNAIKHGDGSPIHVTLASAGDESYALVAVRNRLAGPMMLDWASGQGIGTGLSLVASLSEGVAQIEQQTTAEEITMTLRVARFVPAKSD
jgi:two-component sensor histidine kinase